MDERIPKYLRTIVRKLDFLGMPNLGFFICALAVLAFVGKVFLDSPLDRFIFDPQLVLAGEWWRVFAFPVMEGNQSPIWFLFYVLYIYFVMGALEGAWGPGPITVFTLFCYIMALAGSFFAGHALSVWFYVLQNIGLAFGTLFPEMEFYIFFILPVKAKWLSILVAVLLLFEFLTGSWVMKGFLLIVMLPYLLFFGPMLYQNVRTRIKVRRNRSRFDKDSWR